MEELKKLVQIIIRRGVDEIQLLDTKAKKNNKELKLYESLVSGSVTTDEEAIHLLYDEKVSLNAFKMVKSRLRKKLMNQLFFLDLQGSAFRVALAQELECYAKLYQAKALINSGAYDLATSVLKQVVTIATKYEYKEILETCYRSLLEVYANVGEKNNFYKTKELIDELQPGLYADKESVYEYLEAKIEIGRSVSTRKAYLDKIDDKLKRMEKLWQNHRSFSTFYHYHFLSSWSHELRGNYDKIIELNTNFEEMLYTNQMNPDRFDLRFNKYIQVYAHLRTKSYNEGLRLASLYESEFNSSTNNWFAYMENYLLLALHSKKYEIAHVVLQKVFNNLFYNKIKKLAQERWSLFEAYLHFVAPIAERPFQLQAFVQNVPTYSKDKEGYNVAILILQVMYYLERFDAEALAYRTEALKKYSNKHFKDTFSDRSRLFFRLLVIMVQANFDPKITEKKGNALLQKLIHTTPPGDAYAEIEIIPYEQLWELIISRLYQLASTKR